MAQYYVGDNISNGESLYHYGVLGMKWGVHKDPNYEYRSLGQKHTSKRAQKMADRVKKLKAKGAKQSKIDKAERKQHNYESRSKSLKELDDRELRYAKKMSVGVTAVDRLFLGSLFTSKPTQQFYAIFKNGKNSETAAIGKSVVAAMFTGRLGSEIARSVHARRNDK